MLENLIMKEKVIGFIKKDTVLCVATTLAMVSAFFVKPTLNYVNYIDFRVLGILLSLMTVMAGLQRKPIKKNKKYNAVIACVGLFMFFL